MLLGYTAIPLLLAGIAMICYKILERRKDDSTVDLQNRIFSSILLGTFLILPTMSVKIFSTFACKEFDRGFGKFLKVDFSINCDSVEHSTYKLYAYLMILMYPIGIPVLYYYLLNKARKFLDPGQRKFASQLKGVAAGRKKALKERKKYEKLHPEVLALSFLYEAYEPQYYWFEVFETLRKLVLTGGLVFLNPGTASQIIVSMILCLGSMRVYSGYKPFNDDKVDTFAEVAQWQLFFTMFAALAIRVEVDGESLQDRVYFDLTLVVLQFIAPVIVVVHYAFFEARGDWETAKNTLTAVDGGGAKIEPEDPEDQGEIELGNVPRGHENRMVASANPALLLGN